MWGGWLCVDKPGEIGFGSSTSEGAALSPSAQCSSWKISLVRLPAYQLLLLPAWEYLWRAWRSSRWKQKLHSNNAAPIQMWGFSHLILKIMIACSQGHFVLLLFLRVDKLRKREVEWRTVGWVTRTQWKLGSVKGFWDKDMVRHYYFELMLNKWPLLMTLVGLEFFWLEGGHSCDAVVLLKDLWKKPASCFPSFLRTNQEEIGFSHMWNLYIHPEVHVLFKRKRKEPQDASSAKSVHKMIKLMAAITCSNKS